MLIMTVITFANVVFRTLDDNILWSTELTKNLFAWLVIIGASYCVREKSHISIDAFVKKAQPKYRFNLSIIAAVVSIIYALILFIGGINSFYEEYLLDIEMEDMPIKEWLFKSILPIGFLLLLFRCSEVLVKIFKNKKINLK